MLTRDYSVPQCRPGPGRPGQRSRRAGPGKELAVQCGTCQGTEPPEFRCRAYPIPSHNMTRITGPILSLAKVAAVITVTRSLDRRAVRPLGP